MRARIFAALIVTGTCNLWPALAEAQTLSDPVAVQLKKLGDVAIEAGQFDEALRAYTKALSIEPSPALHYNRGRALQALGRNAEALDEFERFEATAPAELKAAVPELAEMVALVRSHVAEISVDCRVRGATLHFGDQVVELPLRKPIRLEPATLEVRATASGYEPWGITVTLVGGEHRVLVPELKPQDLRGTLTVTSSAAGATVTLDGTYRGVVPLEVRLSHGEHSLTLQHADYQSATTQVVLRARERRAISLSLSKPPRVYERWWFWTGVGTAVAAGVVTGIALTTEKSPAKGDIPPGQIKASLVAW